MIILAILLTTILLVGCGNTAADKDTSTEANVTTWETGNINSWENDVEVKEIEVKPIEITETVLTETILEEETLGEEVLVEEHWSTNARDLKKDMCDENIYFIDEGGYIKIWGKEEYVTQDHYMAFVRYDIETYEIEYVIIDADYISKNVFDMLDEHFIGDLWYVF